MSPATSSTAHASPGGRARRLPRHAVQALATLVVLAVFLAVASGHLELALEVDTRDTGIASVAATPEFLVLVAVGLVLTLLLPLLSPIGGSVLTFVAMLPVYWLGYDSLHRPLIPMEYSLLTILALFLVHVLASYFREAQQKQRVIDMFGQYVPPALALRLSRDPGGQKLEGESRELTILFCDVKGFTRHAEQMDPKELSALLNDVLTPLTAVVHRHGGTIDKYMGDAIMAFWGAPLPDRHHAANAVAAAFEMQEAVAGLARPFSQRGWPTLEVGIGINTGTVHVGNMGSRYRMAYTAIGDAVNLASRLQSLTRVFQTAIIVGEATRNAFPAATYRELGLVQVKGKQSVARIYEPLQPELDPQSTALSRLGAHERALAAYYRRHWDEAEQGFASLHRAYPSDPLYRYYLERTVEFRGEPPPPDWQGELRFSVG